MTAHPPPPARPAVPVAKSEDSMPRNMLRGLLMDGERKSIEPMADRLPDGDVQALQQFVNQSP